MSCDSNINHLVKSVKVGIARLSSKRGFYAGVALGAAGLGGAGLVVMARRLSNPRQNQPSVSDPSNCIVMSQIPKVQTQTKVKPTAKLSGAERCAICRTPAGSKPGSWYTIGNQVYCPDCAGSGANRHKVALMTSEPVLPTTSYIGGTQGSGFVVNGSRSSNKAGTGGVPVAAGELPPADILPGDKTVQTRLVHSKVGIRVGDTPEGQPIPYITQNGQVVIRRDNSEPTGLALVPTLIFNPGRPEAPISENLDEWWIIHIPSGRNVSHRAYTDKKAAWQLASVLAQLDWNRDEFEIPDALISKANNTISYFDYYLDKSKKSAGNSTSQTVGGGAVPMDQSLEGRILTTKDHGILRVMKDEGLTLFVIDSAGSRHVIDRSEVTLPTPADFESLRVAVPLEPPTLGEQVCSLCGAKAKEAKPGARWYMMGWKTYCDSCGPGYANQDDYELPENIGVY